MFADKYSPTTQKDLFHKAIVSSIRKWLSSLDEYESHNVKQALYLSGPTASGKSKIVHVLTKAYNVHSIDAAELKSSERCNEIAQSIPAYNGFTIGNSKRKNIVVIDTIDLGDKFVFTFLDTLHTKQNINVPVILIGCNSKYATMFGDNTVCLQLPKPSLLELNKLIAHISTTESLKLSKDQIYSIIEKSQRDIRQVFHLLEQWSLHTGSFDNFMKYLPVKHVDIDLADKVKYLMDNRKEYEIDDSFVLSSSEPLTISCGLYQNYLSNMENIDNAANVIDSISQSNVTHDFIFNQQCWDVFDAYTIEGCVIPSYHIKQDRKDNDTPLVVNQFKDICYNFANSFNEIKYITTNRNIFSRLNRQLQQVNNWDLNTCFAIANIMVQSITTLTKFFESNKRGKNTTKQEKIDLCISIEQGNDTATLEALNKVLDVVYSYHLFEIDIDEVIINHKRYAQDEYVRQMATNIDLRLTKRFINIFTLSETNKLVKSHVELALKYKLLQKILKDVETYTSKITCQKNMDSFVEDLSSIWKI
jgi:hypothetical protein